MPSCVHAHSTTQSSKYNTDNVNSSQMSDSKAKGDNQESLYECAVCQKEFIEPKFLPCFHTFCAICIEHTAQKDSQSTFPCPACQELTSLPPGGASKLQTNYYVRDAKIHNKVMCKVHTDEKLRFYCVLCEEAICMCCKLTKHNLHEIQDLLEAAEVIMKGVTSHQESLKSSVEEARERLRATTEDQQILDTRRSEVERQINIRHDALLNQLNRARVTALDSLSTVCESAEAGVVEMIRRQEDHLKELLRIQQQMQQEIMNLATETDVIEMHGKALRCGRCREAPDACVTRKQVVRVPVLNLHELDSHTIDSVQKWFGSVVALPLGVAEAEMAVDNWFSSGTDLAVFSLCHVDTQPPCVLVSFEQRLPSQREWAANEQPVVQISERTHKHQNTEYSGRVSCKRYAKGCSFNVTCLTSSPMTLTKAMSKHYKVANSGSGKAEVHRTYVLSSEPFMYKDVLEFGLEVGLHRAVDVDSTGKLIVVVEEPTKCSNTSPHKVKMFRRPETSVFRRTFLSRRSTSWVPAVCTYNPPNAGCRPSDVCFYQLGGLQMLLVADEGGDSIHVVQVSQDQLVFQRYLISRKDCPQFVKPTALNVDVQGRLWVACAGENTILCLRQGTRHSSSKSLKTNDSNSLVPARDAD